VKGAEYVIKYTDGYGNICICLVDYPDLIAKFFASSNVIDTHNLLRQFLLSLEKKWLTQKAFLPLCNDLPWHQYCGHIPLGKPPRDHQCVSK
jgi:hypothetical protein